MTDDSVFYQEYGDLTTLYSSISRSGASPLFLKRNLRMSTNRHDKSQYLNCELHAVKERGGYIIALLTLFRQRQRGSDRLVRIHDTIEVASPAPAGGTTIATLRLPKLEMQSGSLCLLVIFRSHAPDATATDKSLIVSQVLSSILNSSSGVLPYDKVYFGLGALLPKRFNSKVYSKEICTISKGPLLSSLQPMASKCSILTLRRMNSLIANERRKSASDTFDVGVTIGWKKTRDTVVTKSIIDPIFCQSDVQTQPKSRSMFIHYLCPPGKKVDESDLPCSMTAAVEHRRQISCPWCPYTPRVPQTFTAIDDPYLEAKQLVLHLVSTHLYCIVEPIIDHLSNFHLVIRRDRACGVGSNNDRKSAFSYFRRDLSQPRLQIDIPRILPESLPSSVLDSAVSNAKNLESGEFSAPVLARQFYHARDGVPIIQSASKVDSDDEDDSLFEFCKACRALDEFEDVSIEEKLFMKLWNNHVHSFPAYSDSLLPIVYERFVCRFADILVRKKLRYNLMLHLFALWDFGLVTCDEVSRIIGWIDKYQVAQGRQLNDKL